MRLGWSAALLLAAVPAAYVFGLGWVRTTAPVAAPVESGNLLIQLEAATHFTQAIGLWPVVSTVTYPNSGPIRGQIRDRAGGDRTTDYKIQIASKTGTMSEVRCLRDYNDACYFYADLGRTDLTEGVVISLNDVRDGQVVGSPTLVHFTRRSRYSFAFWDGLMSV